MLRLSPTQKALLEEATAHYQQHLPLAETYLQGRGLWPLAANTYRLGVVADPFPGHEQYSGRLAIPYLTATGVVDIRFRSLYGEEPKYLGLPGSTTRMFSAYSTLTSSDFIAVCEGEIDTITLNSIGIPAVGVPGVSNWKQHFAKILQDFDRVYVFADGDKPGQDFAKKVSHELRNVTVIQMEENEDVNSTFCKHGSQPLLSAVGIHPEPVDEIPPF